MAPPQGQLKRGNFEQSVPLFSLRVQPKIGNSLRAVLDEHVLRVPTVRSIFKDNDSLVVLLKHLAATPVGDGAVDLAELPGNLKNGPVRDKIQVLQEITASVESATAKAKGVSVEVAEWKAGLSLDDLIVHEISFGFDIWSAESILRKLLPENVTVPTGFETVGHILHLNLREEHEPYKQLIAEVLLAKHRTARTVVNKTANTGGAFRVFPMEVLFGENNLVASVKENGCRFTLDFAEVYWNSRLETEHRRIVDSLTPEDCLADSFAGVGPFAIPAAKRGVRVYANDMNPSSVEYMEKNRKANGVSDEWMTTSCSCAREFIPALIASETHFSVVTMNFPSGAPEFLDVFIDAYAGRPNLALPLIHCYCFADKETWESSAIERVRANLYPDAADGQAGFSARARNVRNVAPTKVQVCVSFRLPPDVARLAPAEPRAAKRARADPTH